VDSPKLKRAAWRVRTIALVVQLAPEPASAMATQEPPVAVAARDRFATNPIVPADAGAVAAARVVEPRPALRFQTEPTPRPASGFA
jgi:hypothetical protein